MELEAFLNAVDSGELPSLQSKHEDYDFANFNAAPTATMPVCHLNDKGDRIIEPMFWWYMMWKPKGGKPNYKFSTFNARKDTLSESKLWIDGYQKKQRRCIVPMTGFIEFTGPKGNKTCHYFTPKNDQFWGAAGIYSPISHIDGLGSFTIITVDPNEKVDKVHDRMPAILHPTEFNEWLNPEHTPEFTTDLLQPYPDDDMNHRIISPEASSTKNNYPELLLSSDLFG